MIQLRGPYFASIAGAAGISRHDANAQPTSMTLDANDAANAQGAGRTAST